MKNSVRYIVASITLSAGTLIAYPIKIKNASDAEVTLVIELALCSEITVTLLPGETKTAETGLCCSKKITASGKLTAPGSFGDAFTGVTFTPPNTGFGISCRGYEITIKGGKHGNDVEFYKIESGIK